jgi:CHAT domain-containing protein
MKYILLFLIFFQSVHFLYAQKNNEVQPDSLNSFTWRQLDSIGNNLLKKSNYTEALIYLEKGLEVAQKQFGKQDTLYATAAYDLGMVYRIQGLYEKAEPLYIQSKNIRADVLGKENSDYAASCNILGILYHNQGKYEKAEPLYIEAKIIREKLFGKESMEYVGSSNNLAFLYFERGKYEKAEISYIESKEVIKKILGEEHHYYTVLVNNLALLYLKQGLDKKAEPLFLEVHRIRQKTVGTKHFDYATSCNNLANLYKYQSEYEKAESLYLEAKKIKEEILGVKNPSYASTCDNLANLYVEQAVYEKAEPLYIEAKKIREEVLGKNHPFYATSCQNLAAFYKRIKEYTKAEQLFIEAKKIRETTLGIDNPDYANSCANLASFYREIKEYTKAAPLYEEATRLKMNQLKLIFPILSEDEKQQYSISFKSYINDFTDFVILYQNQKPSLLDTLVNLQLFSKGILFSSTQKMQNQILQSQDTILINLFEKWKQERTNYSKAIQLPLQKRTEQNIDLTKMEAQINEIERELSKKSSLVNQTFNEQIYDLETIQRALEKKEVLIDIIRYEKTNEENIQKENEVIYAALIIPSYKAKSSQVKVVILDKGKELETSEFYYYTNTTIFELDNQDSYNFYWKPINDELQKMNSKGFEKIYFSPDGIYHKMSLQSLYNNQTNDYLIEEQPIEILASSKDIVIKNKKSLKLSLELNLSSKVEAKNQTQVYIIGYPTYDIRPDIKPKDFTKSTTRSTEQDSITKPTFKNTVSEYNGLQRIIGHQKSVTILEGTKIETSQINTLFQDKNIPTLLLQNEQANEQNIKKLHSPPILHIATHGFFIDEPFDSELQTMQDSEDRNLLKNPFLRSGLLLAGCQNPQLQGEDGILSAEEVMNLDLQNTELVVLSACETGLGDLKGGEGVYGLQRAFRQAGAKNVLMSLWKVDDTATQLLMNYFYTAILKGKPKREALRMAQLELKKLYPNPYYWGAFVIVGE